MKESLLFQLPPHRTYRADFPHYALPHHQQLQVVREFFDGLTIDLRITLVGLDMPQRFLQVYPLTYSSIIRSVLVRLYSIELGGPPISRQRAALRRCRRN